MSNYTYHFYLDSETPTPDLESFGQVRKLAGNVRIYKFNLPPVVGGEMINSYIETIKNTCKEYKLIVVGEDPGHMEIYSSENYSGGLELLAAGEELWDSTTKAT